MVKLTVKITYHRLVSIRPQYPRHAPLPGVLSSSLHTSKAGFFLSPPHIGAAHAPTATSSCQISSPKPNTVSRVCARTSCPMHAEVRGQLAGVGSLFPPRGSGNQTWVIGFGHKSLSPLLSLALLLCFFLSLVVHLCGILFLLTLQLQPNSALQGVPTWDSPGTTLSPSVSFISQ